MHRTYTGLRRGLVGVLALAVLSCQAPATGPSPTPEVGMPVAPVTEAPTASGILESVWGEVPKQCT